MIVPSPKLRKSLEKAASLYHEQLLTDDEALDYLTRSRKITREAINHFGLGVVREPINGHEIFRNRISFPYYTTTGITTIRFRYLGAHPEGSSKYLCLTGDTPRLYNVTSLGDNLRVFLTEGETDAITCWMAGLVVVGLQSTSSWKPAFAKVFRNREAIVLADNDDSGQGRKFADQICQSLEGAESILMPKGHDVSSFVHEFGIEALREKVGL